MSRHEMRDMNPRRVIVIDDNPDIHKDFATILTPEGDQSQLEALESTLFGETPQSDWRGPSFELGYATQGQEGINKIQTALESNRPFQLAFVDMRMPPGWDGLKTIQAIWQIDPEIQVVLCTAYSDYSWEEINQQLGITENLLILKKPFDSSEVAQMASTLTQKWILAKAAATKRGELERLVALRTRELEKSNQQLKQEMAERQELEDQLVRSQKMEAIGTLAAGVAHDLNNILSGILSYPDLLLMKLPKDDPMYGPLATIRNSGNKAAAIVQDMLTLARRDVAIKEPFDLAAMVNKFIQGPELRAICDDCPNTRISPRVEVNLPPVNGSAIHLEKVVMNLVANAAEAMGEGGTIRVELSRTTLSTPLPGYSSVKPGDYIKLAVVDEGVGIYKEDIEHIFEPFFTKKKMGRSGTGLGMTVVWDTVNSHDGYIEVNSTVGVGTSISIYLPLSDKALPVADNAPLREVLNGDGERILVVDDVVEQREIAVAIFSELGYRVEAVDSGEAALEYLENQPVDLLLLDMIMDPGIDGLETYQRVLAKTPGQKAVIASGFTKNDRVRTGLELGAKFVHKPYSLEEIARAARQALSER